MIDPLFYFQSPHEMASEKGNPVYKAVLRSVLKAEIQLLVC